MPDRVVISHEVVNRLMYGYHDRQRFTQETPVLPEVWQSFAAYPAERQDLLITPWGSKSALALLRRLMEGEDGKALVAKARLAPLQSFVAASLTFDEMLARLLPLTEWAVKLADKLPKDVPDFARRAFLETYESALAPEGRGLHRDEAPAGGPLRGTAIDIARTVTLAAVIDLAREGSFGDADAGPAEAAVGAVEDLWPAREAIIARIEALLAAVPAAVAKGEGGWIWRVANNRAVGLADNEACATVKADAAYRLFDVSCADITWAVADSGIDAAHPGFKDAEGKSRVTATYDFARLRDLLDPAYSRTNGGEPGANPVLAELAAAAGIKKKRAAELLDNIYRSYETQLLDWSSIEPLLKVETPSVPTDGHGTHVAGIIGGHYEAGDAVVRGMCPDIRLIDLRIIADTGENTEFAVIAALQLVRYLNSHNQYIVVHGVNLSLSIPHVVESYACGRTPVCDECERLMSSGATIVAAAGNYGYHRFQTDKGLFAGYATVSITDPGNADSVITVGATHRRDPHTYGISYFSSRGPTGDGRMKPDLVAPGERIESLLPDGNTGFLDGTSQATPHVSGAAAMLMARYPELNRQPQRIKQILCETATDLGRERAFQGHGLLDVLRALQSF